MFETEIIIMENTFSTKSTDEFHFGAHTHTHSKCKMFDTRCCVSEPDGEWRRARWGQNYEKKWNGRRWNDISKRSRRRPTKTKMVKRKLVLCGGDDADDLLWPHAQAHWVCANLLEDQCWKVAQGRRCECSSVLYFDFLVSAFYHVVKIKIYAGLPPFHQFVKRVFSASTQTHIRPAPGQMSALFLFRSFFPPHVLGLPCSRSIL